MSICYSVNTFSEALDLRDSMVEDDTIFVSANKTTYVKKNPDILQAVKTKQDGWEGLYGENNEH